MLKDFFPAELANTPHWTRTQALTVFDEKTGGRVVCKAPVWGEKVNDRKTRSAYTGETLSDVTRKYPGLNYGFFVAEDNEYIVVDIDDSTVIPAEWPLTLAEYSISGTGVHLFYRTEQSKSKHATRVPLSGLAHGLAAEGQVSIKNTFTLVTGKPHPRSSGVIATIRLTDFVPRRGQSAALTPEVLPSAAAVVESSVEGEIAPFVPGSADMLAYVVKQQRRPDLFELRDALEKIPVVDCPDLRDAWTALTGNAAYQHYDVWLAVGMALHSAFPDAQGFELFYEWSRRDPEKCPPETGYDVCVKKWESFSLNPTGVSWSTIFGLAKSFRAEFPVLNNKGIPVFDAAQNLDEVLRITKFKAHYTSGFFFFEGKPEHMRLLKLKPSPFRNLWGPVEEPELDSLYDRFLTAIAYKDYTDARIPPTSGQRDRCIRFLKQKISQNTLNLFNLWLDDGPDYAVPDAQGHTFQDFMECVQLSKWQDENLARMLFYKAFMGLMKIQTGYESPFMENSGMLILCGAENTRKTSFIKNLVPLELRKYFVASVSEPPSEGKGLRDFKLILSGKPLVLIDEIGGVLSMRGNQSELFKNISVAESFDMVPLYSMSSRTVARKGTVFATTNSTDLQLTGDGTRRCWLVRVDYLDTDRQQKMNFRAFYRLMREQFNEAVARGETPWTLSKDDITLLEMSNKSISKESGLRLILEEYFPISEPSAYLLSIDRPDLDKRLFTINQVVELIRIRSGQDFGMKRAEIRASIAEYCRHFMLSGMTLDEIRQHPYIDYEKGCFRYYHGTEPRYKYPLPLSAKELKEERVEGI